MSAAAAFVTETGPEPNLRTLEEDTRMTVLTQPLSRRRTDEIQFRLIYGATLPFFVAAALVQRLVPSRRRRRSDRDAATPSIVREAKSAARTCGSFALMG